MIPVTSLSSYLFCPRSIYLTRVLKVKPLPKKAIIKGTIKHNTFDYMNKVQEKIVKNIQTKDIEEIFKIYNQNYSQALRSAIINNKALLRKAKLPLIEAFKQMWPLFQKESKFITKHIHGFITLHNVVGDKLWELLTPKIKSEVRIQSKKFELRGVIDKLEVFPQKVVPIEMKSGKMMRKGLWPGHRIQLAAYLLMLREKHIKTISSGFIHYMDHDEKRELTLNPFLTEEVIETKNKVVNMLKSKNLPDFCQNKNKCNSCSLKPICYSYK
tara:strand:- start:466 stop:1275 length:810 start_codon:yes stop_codon:yes gene_type:complete